VLGDELYRVSVLGGREGMPRSLGSVYGGSVTRFLGRGLRGIVHHVIHARYIHSLGAGVAVSADGSRLVVSGDDNISGVVQAYSTDDHTLGCLKRVGAVGDGPLQFSSPWHVCVADDDFVFVADSCNDRVQVLTPDLDFHCFVGVGQLSGPAGVCADADIVVVSERHQAHRISVFNRCDGALLRRFGSRGSGDGQLNFPCGLCFLPGHREIAVAEVNNCRVSVFSVGGDFIRHVGVDELERPMGVACSAFDELVIADTGHRRVVVLSASDEVVETMVQGSDPFTDVAIHGRTIFAYCAMKARCVVFT
jgi:DNA-binding beta-propeller fold protein YncE